jgi:error-prone DNA polymerase
MRSDWLCIIEDDGAVRLGLCVVNGFNQTHAEHLLGERTRQPFHSLEDFKARAALNKDELRTLAEIGALNCLAAHRRDALWQVEKPHRPEELFTEHPQGFGLRQSSGAFTEDTGSPRAVEDCRSPGRWRDCPGFHIVQSLNESKGDSNVSSDSPLLPMTPVERLTADFSGMDLTTGPHPMALVRSQLPNIWRATDLPKGHRGQKVRIAGNVICRQRPGTAKGFVFISLEDETGVSNAIVAPPLFEKLRLVITQESFLIIEGLLQNADGVVTVKARHIEALRHEQLMGSASHDFH